MKNPSVKNGRLGTGRGRRRPWGLEPVLAAGLLLLGSQLPEMALAEEELPLREIKKKEKSGDLPFLTLPRAVNEVRRTYQPFIVFYDGGAEYRPVDGDLPGTWLGYLEDRTFQKSLRDIHLGRVGDEDLDLPFPKPAAPEPARPGGKEKAPPPLKPELLRGKPKPLLAVSRKLGLIQGLPALILLDFRERVVKRYTREIPGKNTLRRVILLLVKKNRAFAVYARRAEKVLEQSLYAFQLGNPRLAVQKLLPLEDPREKKKMDSILLERVTEIAARYRSEARVLLKSADQLDAQKKYARALLAYEEAARKFPFPDVIREANQKRGTILRKAQLGI